MDTDDLEPRAKKAGLKDLDPLSIAMLEDYIVDLKAEIVRTEAAIAAKKAARSGADAVFKT